MRLLTLPTSDLTAVGSVQSFTLDVGDTFIFHLNFIGGELRYEDTSSNLEYVGLNFQSGAQTGFGFSGNFHFENVTGQLLMNDITHGFGGPIGGSTPNANLTDEAFSFSGLTFTVNVNYKEPGRPSFTSDRVEFRGIAEKISVVSPIPEPTTLAIWSLLGGIGLVVSRRRRKQAA